MPGADFLGLVDWLVPGSDGDAAGARADGGAEAHPWWPAGGVPSWLSDGTDGGDDPLGAWDSFGSTLHTGPGAAMGSGGSALGADWLDSTSLSKRAGDDWMDADAADPGAWRDSFRSREGSDHDASSALDRFSSWSMDSVMGPEMGIGPAPAAALGYGLTTTVSSIPVYTIGEFAAFDPAGDSLVAPLTTSSAPLINLDDFRADLRFNGIDGSGFASVILDTGIDLNHAFFGPDANFDGVADRIVYQYDFANGDANASDVNGHGSNVASIIGSGDSTWTGVAPGVDIIALKVFTDAGAGYFSYIESALQWVVANAASFNIASVNMSLGDSGNYSSPVQLYGLADEMAALAAQGVIVVSASGNSFYNFNSVMGVSYPAADPNSLSVGAVYDSASGGWSYGSGAIAYSTTAGAITPFSQRDDRLTDIFAPGAPITGANYNGGTVTMHGTSQASPHIAGVAVLAQDLAMQTLGRKLTVTEFTDLMRATATTIVDGDDENDNVTNTGLSFPLVNMQALGEAILAMAAPQGVVTAADVTVVEGNSSAANAVITVNLAQVVGQDVTLSYATVAGGNATSGVDFNAITGALTIAAGATSGQVLLPIRGDTLSEGTETVLVRLSNFSGGSPAGGGSTLDVTVSILDNDPVASIAALDADKDEGNSGTTAFTFMVTRTGGSAAVFEVDYVVAGSGGNPADAADFGGALPSGTLLFQADQFSKTLTILVAGDTVYDRDEGFAVTLLVPPGTATIGTATATGMIRNDDASPGPDLMEGTDADDTLSGLGGDDTLRGNGGDDHLDGGMGADLMEGGAGDDSYVVDSAGDVVVEGSGAPGFVAPAGWTIKGTADLDGDGQTDVLVTNGSVNQLWLLVNGAVSQSYAVPSFGGGWPVQGLADLDGDGDKDVLYNEQGGGRQYGVFLTGVTVVGQGLVTGGKTPDAVADLSASVGGGTDHVTSWVSYALPSNVENLTLAAAGAIDGTGNAADNVIVGNGSANTLTGGGGADTLTGGGGADEFVFDNGCGNDIIADFLPGAGSADRINVADFSFASFAALLAASSDDSGPDTVIQLDADDSVLLRGVGVADLNADDFIFA